MKFGICKGKTNSGRIQEKCIYEADLDQALDVAGIGYYNIKYCLILAFFIVTSTIEPFGYGFVLPAAKCDLQMNEGQRGIIASIPYIGILASSFPWGYLIDTWGRKRALVYSSLFAGIFSIISAFMPNLITFAVCKLLSSLCISCTAAAPYTYIAEILPPKYRDVAATVMNPIQIMGSALVPLLAWGILSLDFKLEFGIYVFRPWRLLCLAYGSFFIIAAILAYDAPESPKFLMSQNRIEESLNILKIIYSKNKKKALNDYPIKTLKREPNRQTDSYGFRSSLKRQSAPLLQPPYIKWIALNSFLLFGVYANLSGLYVWTPDFVNRIILFGGLNGASACDVIVQELPTNSINNVTCDDSINTNTSLISFTACCLCSIVALPVSISVKVISKKTLISFVLLTTGVCCVLINFVKNGVLLVIFMQSLVMTTLAIGPIGAYTTDIFPTHLRGMAMCLVMMVGRTGAIFGSNLVGSLINTGCVANFYIFGGLLLICAFFSFCLPNDKSKEHDKTSIEITKL
ncbi:synaptic vesicle glycoprotein 2A [Papilio machaon]|uniref:synaptic vesicle glycoprotein 2A n=1 Tax=Papilio machaon TaxID=76193 RepID=UPI001E6650E0|nr:synaptic vesicle glycoprotein 2A [Papilio machaon]